MVPPVCQAKDPRNGESQLHPRPYILSPIARFSTDARLTNVALSCLGLKVTHVASSTPIHTSYTNSTETSNTINTKHGGYDNVSEFIPIGQPHASTLSKIDTLKPSDVTGDREYLYILCYLSLNSLFQQSMRSLWASRLRANTSHQRRLGPEKSSS